MLTELGLLVEKSNVCVERARELVGVIASIKKGKNWDDLDPEYILVGRIVQLACKDALQTKDERLRIEAQEFLLSFAPEIEQRLRALLIEERENNYDNN